MWKIKHFDTNEEDQCLAWYVLLGYTIYKIEFIEKGNLNQTKLIQWAIVRLHSRLI